MLLRYEDFVKSPELALSTDVPSSRHPVGRGDARLAEAADSDSGPRQRQSIVLEEPGWKSDRDNRTVPRCSSIGRLPTADLQWLESEFRDFNAANGYAPQLPPVTEITEAKHAALTDSPSFQVTRRYEWETKRKPIRWFLSQIGMRNTKLIDRRSWKRAA